MHTMQSTTRPARSTNNGHQAIGRPSWGCRVIRHRHDKDLPGFVVLLSGNQPDGGKSCWGSGFLPTVYQGVEFVSRATRCSSNPEGVAPETRRRSLDLLAELNRAHLNDTGDPEIATRIASYEMSYRMNRPAFPKRPTFPKSRPPSR